MESGPWFLLLGVTLGKAGCPPPHTQLAFRPRPLQDRVGACRLSVRAALPLCCLLLF